MLEVDGGKHVHTRFRVDEHDTIPVLLARFDERFVVLTLGAIQERSIESAKSLYALLHAGLDVCLFRGIGSDGKES